jgi:signal transduction histidine kinase
VGPLLLAAVATAGTFGAAHSQPGRRAPDALAVVLVVLGALALVGLGRRPREVAWFVAAATLAYLLVGYPYGPVIIPLVVAVVATVASGHRTTGWLVVGVVLAAHLLGRALATDHVWSWGQALGVTAWALVLLAVAEVVRGRRERAVSWRQAREEARRREAGEERLRIAQELHDVVAHHMSLINVQASVALHLAEHASPEPVEPALEAIKAASKEALTEMRALVGVLRADSGPAPRAPAPSLRSLDELVERSRHAGLEVRRVVTGDERPLPAAVELAAFRIVQEAITNVVRHAGARRADVRLGYGPDRLVVEVEDDGGGGAAAAGLGGGNGIRGMRERATALGGVLAVEAAPSGGLVVRAELPLGST